MTLYLPDFKQRLKDAICSADEYKDEFYDRIENTIIADLLKCIAETNARIDFTPATILECVLFFGYNLVVFDSGSDSKIKIKVSIGEFDLMCIVDLKLYKTF